MSNRIDEIKKRYKQAVHIQNRTAERKLLEMDVPWLIEMAERIAELEAENAQLKGDTSGGASGIVGRGFHDGVVATKDATIAELRALKGENDE